MGSIAGEFFRPFGFTVAIAVLFSLLVARMLTPMMAAYGAQLLDWLRRADPWPALSVLLVLVGVLSAGSGAPSGAQSPAAVVVHYVANAGVLVEIERTRLLIDAPIREGIPPYATSAPEERERLEQARPPYERVDAILITHWHEDHFSAEAVAAHLARNARAVLVSSQNQNREWIYSQQQTVSSGGFAGTAFSTYVPHTVRGRETRTCTDCHVSGAGDNNAWMASLLMQGSGLMSFIGRYAWVGEAGSGLESVVVTEREEPQFGEPGMDEPHAWKRNWLVALLPGRMRFPETAVRRSSRRPAICCSGPWHPTQDSWKIGITSRAKSTRFWARSRSTGAMVGASMPSTWRASDESVTDLAERSMMAPPADSRLLS